MAEIATMAGDWAVVALVLIGLALAVLATRIHVSATYPQAVAFAAPVVLVLDAVVLEVLSAANVMTVLGIRLVGLVAVLVLAVVVFLGRARLPRPAPVRDRADRIIYAAVGVLAGTALVTGVQVAPNNWDSMAYHLPRAMQWLQSGNLGFFVAANPRQNLWPPLADEVSMQMIALRGNDHLAFLGQWIAGVVVLACIGIVARYLFGEGRVVALSVAIAAAVPMLALEMSTTQADVLASVPVLAGAVAVIVWLRGQRWVGLAQMVACVAASPAIKTTALLFLAPIVIVLLWQMVKARWWRGLMAFVVASVVAGIAVAGRHTWLVLSHRSQGGLATEVFSGQPSLSNTLSNLIRDTASQMQTGYNGANTVFLAAARWLLSVMGLDPDANTLPKGEHFNLYDALNEDVAGAPLHMVLIIVALVAAVIAGVAIKDVKVRVYVLVLAAQCLLFATIVNWQPWLNRFTFTGVVLAAPLVGWLLAQLSPVLRYGLVGLAVLGTIWIVLITPARGMLGTEWLTWHQREFLGIGDQSPASLSMDRWAQGTNASAYASADYRDAFDYVNSLEPDRIQLVETSESLEYFVWAGVAEPRPVIAAREDPRVAAPAGDRLVRVCLTVCPTDDLSQVAVFPERPGPNPFHQVLPITVGVVEPAG